MHWMIEVNPIEVFFVNAFKPPPPQSFDLCVPVTELLVSIPIPYLRWKVNVSLCLAFTLLVDDQWDYLVRWWCVHPPVPIFPVLITHLAMDHTPDAWLPYRWITHMALGYHIDGSHIWPLVTISMDHTYGPWLPYRWITHLADAWLPYRWITHMAIGYHIGSLGDESGSLFSILWECPD